MLSQQTTEKKLKESLKNMYTEKDGIHIKCHFYLSEEKPSVRLLTNRNIKTELVEAENIDQLNIERGLEKEAEIILRFKKNKNGEKYFGYVYSNRVEYSTLVIKKREGDKNWLLRNAKTTILKIDDDKINLVEYIAYSNIIGKFTEETSTEIKIPIIPDYMMNSLSIRNTKSLECEKVKLVYKVTYSRNSKKMGCYAVKYKDIRFYIDEYDFYIYLKKEQEAEQMKKSIKNLFKKDYFTFEITVLNKFKVIIVVKDFEIDTLEGLIEHCKNNSTNFVFIKW